MKQKQELWTIDAWLQQFGQEYGLSLKGTRYIQKCCAGETIVGGHGYTYTAHLPEGWKAQKIFGGRGSWLIERESSNNVNNRFWTVDTWLEEFNHVYDLHNRQYLVNCCAGLTLKKPDGRIHTCKLPDGWSAIKVPGGKGRWLIYESNDKQLIIHTAPAEKRPSKKARRAKKAS